MTPIPYLKLLIIGFVLIMGIGIGWGMADTIKVKPLKAEVGKLSIQLNEVIGVNERNDKVQAQAQNRYDRMAKSYEDRLKLCKKECQAIQDICNLPPSQGGKPDAQSNKPLLDRLNGLYP